MNSEAIIRALATVSWVNASLTNLAWSFRESSYDATRYRDAVVLETDNGSNLFEALTKIAPVLANDIHGYVYLVSHAHESITTKNLAIEKVIKIVLELV
jgi:hypothetical protein